MLHLCNSSPLSQSIFKTFLGPRGPLRTPLVSVRRPQTFLHINFLQTISFSICQTARSMERSIFFFLKSHISAPGAQNSPIFFPSVIYPLYLHVIIDFGHIWGPFMAEIEKMCQKSAFLVVPDFGYPQSRCPPWKI